MMNRKYKISVIIVSYNYGRFLEEAIESVIKQTWIPDEILIIDDYSDDNTEEIGKKYASRYSKLIKFHRNKENMGIVNNFNNAIKMTSGELVCFLGADNIFTDSYLEETASILLSDDRIGIAYTDFVLFGDRAKIVYDDFVEERKGEIIDNKYYVINFPEFNKDELAKGNYIHGSSMYRRDAFEQIGGYKNEGTDPEDYNLFYRMILKGWKAKRVAKPILQYRQHSTEQANVKNITIAQLEYYKKDNEKLKKFLFYREKDVEELKDGLEHRERDIEELKSGLEHRERDIEELKEGLEHREGHVKKLKEHLMNKEKDIQELKTELTYRYNDIQELKSALIIKDNHIEELRSILELKENDIQQLINELHHRESDIEELKSAL